MGTKKRIRPTYPAADYLIVGQGIAGTMMAWHLIKGGKKVIVVDNGEVSASLVAAGLFNPVTGRRFVKSWRIDELLPYAEKAYKEIGQLLGNDYFHKLPIVRYLQGPEESMVYERSLSKENKKYIAGFSASEGDKLATCEIKGGGYVDMYELIYGFRWYLEKKKMLIEKEFHHNDLVFTPFRIRWKGISAKYVIFCEGYKATANPYFPNLPFKLVKGEILTVKIPKLKSDKILMSGGYLIPTHKNYYKLGSTYEWDDLTPNPTWDGERKLLDILYDITHLRREVISHKAGIRPAVIHRRPLLGKSPVHDRVFILNGMGTKGVILAPFFANQLTEYLLKGKKLDMEVDVSLL